MPDPYIEAVIAYRRFLQERNERETRYRWGRTFTVLKHTTLRKRVWHLTRFDEAPCRSVCGYKLIELGPRGMDQPWNMCKSCRVRSRDFLDFWEK